MPLTRGCEARWSDLCGSTLQSIRHGEQGWCQAGLLWPLQPHMEGRCKEGALTSTGVKKRS